MGEVKKEVRGAIIGTVVAAVVGGIIAWLSGVVPTALGWLGDVLGDVWGWLWSTTPVAGWLLVTILVLAAIGAAKVAARFPAGQRRPEWEMFRAMIFDGVLWTWTWRGEEPVGLKSFCPRDCMELRFTDYRREVYLAHNWRLVCQKCEATFGAGWSETDGPEVDASFEIRRLIRTGEWRQMAPVSVPQG